MVQDGLMNDLRAHGNLRTVINKLPEKLQQSWSRNSFHLKTEEEPDITHLNDWLKTKVLEDEEYRSFVLPKSSKEAEGKHKSKSKEKSGGSIVTMNHIRTEEVTPPSSASDVSGELKVKHECYVVMDQCTRFTNATSFSRCLSMTDRKPCSKLVDVFDV